MIVLVVRLAAQQVHVQTRTVYVAAPDRLIGSTGNDRERFPAVGIHDEAHHLTGNRRVGDCPTLHVTRAHTDTAFASSPPRKPAG